MVISFFGFEFNWPSQVAGIVAAVFYAIAFFSKKKVNYLIFHSISLVFLFLEMLFLQIEGANTVSAMISQVLSIFRNLIAAYLISKKGKELPFWAGVSFIVLFWVTSIPFFNEWYSYLPPVLNTLFCVGVVLKGELPSKIGGFLAEVGYVVYNLFVGAYFGMFRDGVIALIGLASIILLIIRMRKKAE